MRGTNWIFKYNTKITWFITITLGIVTYILNFRIFRNATGSICLLDGIRISMYMMNIIILLILVSFWHMNVTKDDFASIIVIKHHDRIMIWLKQVKRIIIASAFYSLIIELFGLASALEYSSEIINWNKATSFFSQATKSITPIKSFSVLLSSYLNIWFLMVVLVLLLILSYWIFNTFTWGMCIFVATSFMDTWTRLSPVFIKRVIINSQDWCHFETLILKIFCELILICSIIYIGCIISRRKEFLGSNAERK